MVDSAFITFNPNEVSRYYAARVPSLRQRRAAEWRGTCPIHDGRDNNFAVDAHSGRWFCHSQCGRGGDILELDRELFGGDFRTARRRVFAIVGRQLDEQASSEELQRIRRQRECDRDDLTMAVCWRHALLQHIERQLAVDKTYLSEDEHEEGAAAILVGHYTKQQQRLQSFSRSELLAEFRRKLKDQPRITRELMCEGSEDLEDARLVCVAIVRALELSASQFPTTGVKTLGGSH